MQTLQSVDIRTGQKMIEASFLYLLLVKHAIADLALQSLIKGGDKLDLRSHKGYRHALDHAALTLLVASWFVSVPIAVSLALLDFSLHFWIDYGKSRIVRQLNVTMVDKLFWPIQSLDQILHFTCYWLYTYLIFY